MRMKIVHKLRKKNKNVTTDSESKKNAKNDDNHNAICEGEELNDARGGKYVALVEEAEMSSIPISESVNEKDDTVGEFDASTCSGDNVYDIFENKEEIITEDSIVWFNTNKKISKVGSLKSLSVIFQRIPMISN